MAGDALADYELLELVLFRAIPRRDVKPLAKALLARFGSFAGVVSVRPERLREIAGLGRGGDRGIEDRRGGGQALRKVKGRKSAGDGSFSAVLDYCRTAMAFLDREEFRILFLDKKNFLIADECNRQARSITRQSFLGDHPPRLRAQCDGAHPVHNHPSGDPSPSQTDIQMTRQIVSLGKSLNLAVHDHLIIGRDGFTSFKSLQLI
ncbi:MAG: JAB domain-containing protein [Methylovirgula sp.]